MTDSTKNKSEEKAKVQADNPASQQETIREYNQRIFGYDGGKNPYFFRVRRPVRVSKRTPSEDFPPSTRRLF